VQTTINEAQFLLFMEPKSSVQAASELFHDLDAEETGCLDATALMLVIKRCSMMIDGHGMVISGCD